MSLRPGGRTISRGALLTGGTKPGTLRGERM